MLSKWIVSSYRALAEIALWISILAGAVMGGALGALMGHSYLGTALGAVGGFTVASVLLGASLHLIDLNASLQRIRDDAVDRVPVVPPGLTVSTGAAIARAVAAAKEVEAANGSAYTPPPAPATVEAVVPTASTSPAPDSSTEATPGTGASVDPQRVFGGVFVGVVVLGAAFAFYVTVSKRPDDPQPMSTEAVDTVHGRRVAEEATPSTATASDTPTAPATSVASGASDQETSTATAGEGASLNPQWHGTWDSPDAGAGIVRIEIDANGFAYFSAQGGTTAPQYKYPWRRGEDATGQPRYLAYANERMTRDELVMRYEQALGSGRLQADRRVRAEDALAHLRPGRYKVVTTVTQADCESAYVLDENALVQIEDCGYRFSLEHFVRQ